MIVNIAEELSKPKCLCSRCSVEAELWQEYLEFPWKYRKDIQDKYNRAMWDISPAWCDWCEEFESCPCGELGSQNWCGSLNPCLKHLEWLLAWQVEGKKTLREKWLARKWKALSNNPLSLKQEVRNQVTKVEETFRDAIRKESK